VAYENVLRGDLIEVEDEIMVKGVKSNPQPTPSSLWLFSKENAHYKTVHLINFMNRSDLLWRDDQGLVKAPEIQEKLKIEIPYDSTIKGIYASSPDFNSGSLESLQFSYQEGKISFIVPRLDYWTMILIVK